MCGSFFTADLSEVGRKKISFLILGFSLNFHSKYYVKTKTLKLVNCQKAKQKQNKVHNETKQVKAKFSAENASI